MRSHASMGTSLVRITFKNYLEFFLSLAILFLITGSSDLLRILTESGVISISSSSSIHSIADSSVIFLGVINLTASSVPDVLMLVSAFPLSGLTSKSPGLEDSPITIPEYTLSCALMNIHHVTED